MTPYRKFIAHPRTPFADVPSPDGWTVRFFARPALFGDDEAPALIEAESSAVEVRERVQSGRSIPDRPVSQEAVAACTGLFIETPSVAAARSLGFCGDDHSIEALRSHLERNRDPTDLALTVASALLRLRPYDRLAAETIASWFECTTTTDFREALIASSADLYDRRLPPRTRLILERGLRTLSKGPDREFFCGIRALLLIPDTRDSAVERARAELSRLNDQERYRAVAALLRCEVPRGIALLAAHLRSEPWSYLRALSVSSVGDALEPASVRLLAEGLICDPCPVARLFGYRALARLGGRAERELLESASARETDPYLQQLLRVLLERGTT